jgi:hypothetical protein
LGDGIGLQARTEPSTVRHPASKGEVPPPSGAGPASSVEPELDDDVVVPELEDEDEDEEDDDDERVPDDEPEEELDVLEEDEPFAESSPEAASPPDWLPPEVDELEQCTSPHADSAPRMMKQVERTGRDDIV